ncbi:ribonuclease H-like domain-containing protein [Tanacetum coccineum]
MCDKKNSVLFTDTGCFVLSLDFKLADESQVLLKVPRKNNMYSVDMKNIILKECLTCLVAKAALDESMLWHRRLSRVNFKTINKLVKENLVRGLPTKRFENDQTCVACPKGKQHKASCKSKIQNSITQPLFILHMDLFGPTFVSSLMNKKYCLVVTDDYSRFTWVFFLATKDETSGILKSFITEIENLVDKKVKIIRCDNETEFKNRVMSEFCKQKGIKREFSVAITPQQNGVAERRNRTLIEAARTMLADSKLPTTFWAEAVNTACYVQNRVLVVKPHNKTPYELFRGRTPALSFMRPFGCHVTILNTLDYLGKFDGKSDEGFFIGYLMNSKAFRVYNIRTRKVEENLHIRFLEDKPIIAVDGPKWLFDIDVLTKSMNYVPVVAGTNSNDFVGTEESIVAGYSSKEIGSSQDYILMPLWKDGSLFDSSSKSVSNDELQPLSDARKKDDEGVCKESGIDNATLEATHADFFGDETEVDMSNITTTYPVSSTPNTRIHKDHSLDHVISDVQSGVQIKRMTKTTNEQGFISVVYEGKTHKDLHTCLFACFLSQVEPKKVIQALTDPSWIEAMQDELLQFKLQKVWTLVDLPYGKRAIGTKWVYRNKKDERGIVVRNKARLVAQGYTQEEGIDYDEVFAPFAKIEAIMLFLAYASFMNFVVYQMDVKSAFLYGKIEEEVYVCQPPGFEDPEFPDRVYKVEKALYGLHQAPRAWYETLCIIFGSTKKELCTKFEKLIHKKFQMISMGELTFFLGLQVMQKEDEIFISQDKYVDEILKKFGFSIVRIASTPMETSKPLLKDAEAKDVDVYLYRLMIGSLMYLTASRPDIMFDVCACARFQVTPKVSHLHAMKRIFRYLKGQPKLGLWYPKDLPFDLEAYSGSDYTGASLYRKSIIGGTLLTKALDVSRFQSLDCSVLECLSLRCCLIRLMIGMGWTYYLDKIGVYPVPPRTESLDYIFNRLQKINTHVVVWRNKPNLDIISFDDLYNNFKTVEQKVKGTASSRLKLKRPGNQDNRSRNQDSSRRTINVEEISSKAMLAIDGAGLDWSFMADEKVLINMALMDFLDSKFNKFEFNLATYKSGLASVEEQLVFYKKNEVLFCKELAVLKRDISYKDSEISVLKRYGHKNSKSVSEDTSNEVRESPDASLVEELVSKWGYKIVIENSIFPTVAKINFVRPQQQEKPVRKLVKYAKMYMSQTPRGNKRNWNNQKCQQLGSDFVMYNKACFVCGSFKPLWQANAITIKGIGCIWEYHTRGTCPISQTSRNLMEDMLPLGEESKEGKLLMCGKKNSVLFTDTECFVLSPDFQLADVSQVLLKVPRKNNMYSIDMKNIVPKKSLNCLVTKATLDESMIWHRRLGHVNFKTINKLVKENLVRGLPTKHFENDQTCVACLKGKQHKASCKSKIQNSITQPLFMLHMDLFGLTFVSSLMNKKYCLVVTDDYSRFTWVFFLATKDETSGILKSFITEVENLVDKKVKIIRCDNGTKFKNRVMSEFCKKKGIKKEFSVARTPQQNGVAKRRNRTLIEAARTMLADSKLLTTFWTEAVNTSYCKDGSLFDSSSKNSSNDEPQPSSNAGKKDDEGVCKESGIDDQERHENSTQAVNTAGPSINTASTNVNTGSLNIICLSNSYAILEATHADFFGDEIEVDMRNITTTYPVPSIPNTRIHKYHSLDHVIGDVQSGVQTRRMIKTTNEQGFISAIYKGKTHEDLHTCLFAYFLSQVEPKKKVWTLVDLPYGKRAIGTKWVYRNKKDKRVARIEAIRLFLAYASFMNFVVYQMDVKSAFLYGKIEEEVYVCQPSGFEDPEFPDRVYKTASTPMETSKPLIKDAEAEDVDVHLYRLMIGSLMYLTASRHDIMFMDSTFDWKIILNVVFSLYGNSTKESSRPIPLVADETVSKEWEDRMKMAATTASSLEVEQDSVAQTRFETASKKSNNSPLIRIHTLGSDEGRMQHNELMDLVTKLSDRVVALEKDLKKTKKVYGAAYTKLIKKVKKLEKTVKSSKARRRARIVVSDDEDGLEDSFKQGRKITEHDAEIQGRYEHDMEFKYDFDAAKEVSTTKEVSSTKPVSTASATVTTASAFISTASPTRVSTADDITLAKSLVYIRRSAAKTKDKAKGIMEESESAMTKTKRQQEQERLCLETAIRLQEDFNEEERQRIARVHEEASSFNVEEWEIIQARVEACGSLFC